MAKIELINLTKRFGDVTALNQIDIAVEDGELVALLGPSGCGKTTALRCIAGFEIPDEGEIRADGKLMNFLPPETRDVGMVFQNYALFPHMTVFDNVAYGLRARKTPQEEISKRVSEITDVVGLKGYDARYPRELSGGQQQRVAIARALVINPHLLLLDEPLANLDARLREEMRFYLKTLQRNVGITLIYVTHDQSEALVLADRIIVMFNGVIHQDSTPTDLYKKPKTWEVANFIGLINFLEGDIQARRGNLADVKTHFGMVTCQYFRVEGSGEATTVNVGIRPESIILERADTSSGHANALPGKIADKVYMGNVIEYRVDLGADRHFRVQANPTVDFSVGEACKVAFSCDDAWIVPGAEGLKRGCGR